MGKNAESLFRKTLDVMSDHIAVLDDTGRIVFVNLAWKTFAEKNGFQAENYGIGLNYLDVCEEAAGRSAEGAAETAAGLKDALSGETHTFSCEYPCHSPFQTGWFRVNITGFSLEDTVRVVVIHQEITDLKKTENERVISENTRKAIIASVPDAMCMIDRDMTVVWANEVGKKLFGDSVVGKRCFDAYAGVNGVCENCIVRKTFTDGGIHSQEYTHEDVNGIARTFQCTSTVAQVDDRGAPILVMESLHDITHRKRNEKDMKFMQLAVDTTEDCVYWILSDGTIRYVNRSVLKQMGYRSEEIIGLKVADIDLYVDEENWESAWQRLKQEKVNRFETVHVTKDGQQVPFEVTANYIRISEGEEYNFAVARNIRDRKQAERQIRKLSRAVEYSPASVVITDVHGTIEYVNWKFTEVTGYSYNEVIGENPRILSSGHQTADYYKKLWDTILAGKEWKGEFINYKKNGEVYWESASISPIMDENGEIINFVAVKEDITGLKNLMQDLKEAKEKAESATRAKSDFLATMSHEIRTPMNAILGMGRLALDSGLNETQYTYVNNILSASESLLAIINDILDLSKIEAGKMEIESAEFKLNSVFEKIFNVIKFEAGEKGLDLVFSFERGVPWVMKGDPLRLGQVLMNLVNNAVKYTESGEVAVSVKTVQQSGGSVTLQFSIRDTGIGMTDQQISSLFQPFTQLNGTMSRKYGGTGLGLVIAKRLAEKMGGEIHVESSRSQGSLFTFTVPLEKVEDAKGGYPSFLEKLSGLNVLLIENRESSRNALSRTIEALGMNCHSTGEGGEALGLIDRLEKNDSPDVIIATTGLCKEDTVEVFKRLGADHGTPKVKTILLHDFNAVEKARNMAARVRVDGFLARPVTPLPLVNTILTVMGFGPAEKNENLEQGSTDGETISEGVDRRRILLVEDNEIGRKVVSEFMGRAGLEVYEATNGEQALEMLKTRSFDLVLMDIEMPVMGGIEATRRIRRLEDERLRNLPVIALTGHVMADFKEKCLAAGMNDHLEKPIRREQLYEMVEKWLERADFHTDSATGTSEFDMDVPLIDVKTGMAFAGEKPDLYRRMVEAFIDNFHDAGRRVKEILSRDEPDRARQLVHSIKSEAGHIGAKSFADTCGDLEKALADQDGMAIVTELNEFVPGLDQVLQSAETIKNQLDSPRMIEDDAVDLTGETDLQEELPHLLEYVRKHQPGDCRRVLARIRKRSPDSDLGEEIQAISNLIRKYRFDSAENRILRMLEKMSGE